MQINKISSCDVFVAGAGIAGIMAAISAAEKGQSVILSSSTNIFSGSSFYPGTWGLGLIGPENDEDNEDLIQSILEVGCGMADEEMVRSFVSGIQPSISYVKEMGVKLKQAQDQNQKDFIPCFDHKHRAWNGILFNSAREVFSKKMDELKISQLPNCELIDFICRENRIQGVIVKITGKFFLVECKALVLATGGYGGLFKNRLTTDDVSGIGQYLALKHGCTLKNMEFMQMMPGYLNPCRKTIFNEKTFRYVEMRDARGDDLLPEDTEELLELRSTHGPFTTRLRSREVDFAIVKAQLLSTEGVTVRYKDSIKKNTPEFVETYFEWLKENKNLTVNDVIHIGMFAHAANGGIKIKPDTSTELLGLFACGEITGGMHGADRIGGLSTANGLVFGRRAGMSAAEYANKVGSITVDDISIDAKAMDNVPAIRETMRRMMSDSAMVIRSEKRLNDALALMDALLDENKLSDCDDVEKIADTNKLMAQLHLCKAILQAEKTRSESRGSHYRSDYPEMNEEMKKPIIIKLENADLITCFEE